MEGDQEITFKEDKVKYIDPNHDDTQVISDRIINVLVKRVMIDIDSYIDILYFDVFQKLRLTIMIWSQYPHLSQGSLVIISHPLALSTSIWPFVQNPTLW